MRRTKEDADKTRHALLDAAEQLFLEHGVAHTSLEQIARTAQVTRGALYWHFQNKAHLFHVMLDQVRLPPEQLVERLSAATDQDPLRSLRDLCVEALESLVHNARKRRIFTILLHRCEFTAELREAEERHHTFIQAFIDRAEAQFGLAPERLWPGLSARQAACALHAQLIGLFSDWTRDPGLFDPLQDGAALINAQFRGLIQHWA